MSEFKQISFSGTSALQVYIATPEAEREGWLASQPWYRDLETDHRYKCQYCEDTGIIIGEGGRSRRCPCTAGVSPVQVVPETYFSLNETLRGWEGWPVKRMNELEKLDGFIETETYQAGRKLIEDIQGGGNGALLFCGANGRGKTFTGLMILAESAWIKRKCHAVKMKKLIDLAKNGLDSRQEFTHEMNRIFTSSVVLIDEISAGNRQGDIDHGQRILDEIVHEFHAQKKALIMTSNCYKTELIESLGKSTVSRISKCAGWCTVIEESRGSENLRGQLG